MNSRLKPFHVTRSEKLTHIDAVRLSELAKRLIGTLVIKDALGRITNVTAAIRGSEVRFLLTAADRLENVGHLHRGRFLGLQDFVDFLVIAIRDIG